MQTASHCTAKWAPAYNIASHAHTHMHTHPKDTMQTHITSLEGHSKPLVWSHVSVFHVYLDVGYLCKESLDAEWNGMQTFTAGKEKYEQGKDCT